MSYRFTVSMSHQDLTLVFVRIEYRDYRCAVYNRDLLYCSQFPKEKPRPEPLEFTELVHILMFELIPSICDDGLDLYLSLKKYIEQKSY